MEPCVTGSALIEARELSALIGRNDIKIMDATYGRPRSEVGIPSARDFDIDDVADHGATLPHTAPAPDVFEDKVRALGICAGDTVIVCDDFGIHMAAARVWWMFRLFGHDHVRILNGGTPAWVGAGLPLAPKARTPALRGDFCSRFRPALIARTDDVKNGKWALLDARDAGRFSGTTPDPRSGMASGHIPGSCNVPYTSLIDIKGRLKPREELQTLLHDQTAGNIACTCGSGVTACVVALALYMLGRGDVAVYDGSWAEWNLIGGEIAHDRL